MIPRKLNLMFATFPYGGNGASAAETPTVRNWLLDAVGAARQDDRIGNVAVRDYCDTPITMTRNRAVVDARQHGYDVLVMVDSDQAPDLYVDEGAPKFFESSIDHLYKHWEKGPVVIAAPYCGPPPFENVYVFVWGNHQSDHPNTDIHLRQYSREEAVQMAGIQEAAALPTGLCMFDMRAFELTDPQPEGRLERLLERFGPFVGDGRQFGPGGSGA